MDIINNELRLILMSDVLNQVLQENNIAFKLEDDVFEITSALHTYDYTLTVAIGPNSIGFKSEEFNLANVIQITSFNEYLSCILHYLDIWESIHNQVSKYDTLIRFTQALTSKAVDAEVTIKLADVFNTLEVLVDQKSAGLIEFDYLLTPVELTKRAVTLIETYNKISEYEEETVMSVANIILKNAQVKEFAYATAANADKNVSLHLHSFVNSVNELTSMVKAKELMITKNGIVPIRKSYNVAQKLKIHSGVILQYVELVDFPDNWI